MAAGRNLTLLMLTLCLGAFRDTPAFAQASPSGRPGEARSTQAYFTITGGVARPGVYPFPRQPLQLTELVREAGGLSEMANNNVRIVRDGRAGLQTFYSDTSSYQLMPGDIVCVDERRAAPGTFGWNGRPVTGDPIRNPPMVNVTLINVLDRPVMLQLPAAQATMFNLNRMLGQPQNSTRPVQILNRAATGSRGATATSDMRLTNGTVIVFPAHAIQKHALPALPEPIRRDEPKPLAHAASDQDSVLPPSALNNTSPGALTPPTVLPGATAARNTEAVRSTESLRSPEPVVTQIEVPPSFPLSAPQLTVPGNPLLPALTPPTRMTSQRTESPLPPPSALAAVPTPDVPMPDVPPPPPDVDGPAVRNSSDQPNPQPFGTATSAVHATTEPSLGAALQLSAIVFVLASAGLWWFTRPRKTRTVRALAPFAAGARSTTPTLTGIVLQWWSGRSPRHDNMSPAQPPFTKPSFVKPASAKPVAMTSAAPAPPSRFAAKKPAVDHFEALIQNQLQILEEPFTLPVEMHFHGRPASARWFRADDAHTSPEMGATVPAPHFARQPVPAAEAAPAVSQSVVEIPSAANVSPVNAIPAETSASDTSVAESGRSPRRIPRPHFIRPPARREAATPTAATTMPAAPVAMQIAQPVEVQPMAPSQTATATRPTTPTPVKTETRAAATTSEGSAGLLDRVLAAVQGGQR